jgi:hypothetical protein
MGIAITAETAQIIQWLEPREDVDVALRKVLENEIRRRLAAYELTDRTLQRKYGMTLADFEAANVVKEQGYSYAVESDHQDWDQAVDGIETLREALQKLQEQG